MNHFPYMTHKIHMACINIHTQHTNIHVYMCMCTWVHVCARNDRQAFNSPYVPNNVKLFISSLICRFIYSWNLTILAIMFATILTIMFHFQLHSFNSYMCSYVFICTQLYTHVQTPIHRCLHMYAHIHVLICALCIISSNGQLPCVHIIWFG